jgi:hypothetical protein
MRGEVVGLNTLKLIKKNTSRIAFALGASDLLDALHRFYPLAATSPKLTPTPRGEEMSAGADLSHGNSTPANSPAVSTGTVNLQNPPAQKFMSMASSSAISQAPFSSPEAIIRFRANTESSPTG